jgi:ATP synthase protein I
MSEPDDPRKQARKRLGRDLDSFEAARAPAKPPLSGIGDVGEGYRMLAGLLGGVFGGLGLGWTFDHFVHTSPFGLISGLLIGLGVSIYAAVRSALAMSAKVQAAGPPPAAVADDEDED